MLDDIGRPGAKALGRALGVSPRTADRWIRSGTAPRPVLLSLFWLTRWGMSVVDSEVVNRSQLSAGMIDALACENARLRKELARVIAAADFGCANDPSNDVGDPDSRLLYARWA